MSDTTQRTLRTVLAGLPGVLAIKNKALAYEVVNAPFCQFLAKGPAEIIGKADADLFPAAEAAAATKEQKSVLSSGIPRRVELQLSGKEGPRWFDLALSAVLDDNGDPDGVMISGQDITVFKQREAGIAASESHVAEATAQAAAAQEQLRLVHAEAKELENAAQQVQEHLKQREKQLAQALKQTAAVEAQVQELQTAQQTLQEQANAATAALAAAEARAMSAEAALQTAQDQAARASAEAADAITQHQQLQATLAALQAQHADAAALAQQLLNRLA